MTLSTAAVPARQGRFPGCAARKPAARSACTSQSGGRRLGKFGPLRAGDPLPARTQFAQLSRRRIHTVQHIRAEPDDKQADDGQAKAPIPEVLTTTDAISNIDSAIPSEGVELRNVAQETAESAEEEADKLRIMELLEELKVNREKASEAEGVRMALEAEAQQLGSLALNAKQAYEDMTRKAEEAAEEASNMSERRMVADTEVKELKEELRVELDKLEEAEEALEKVMKERAAAAEKSMEEAAAAAAAAATEEEPEAGKEEAKEAKATGEDDKAVETEENVDEDTEQDEPERLAVKQIEERVAELEKSIEEKRNLSMMLLQEKEELIKSVGLLQQEAMSLEISMINAENIAASAMEAAAGGIEKEVDCDNAVTDVEVQLRELVKNLRVEAMKKQKEKEKAKKEKAKEEKKEEKKEEAEAKVPEKKDLAMDSDDNMMRDVEAMEDLVLRSICETQDYPGTAPTAEETKKETVKQGAEADTPPSSVVPAKTSSKYIAASFFSSSPGPGEPETMLPAIKESIYRNRFYIIGCIVGAIAIAGMLNHSYFEFVFAKLAELQAPLKEAASSLMSSVVPDDLHVERGIIDMLVLLVTSVIAVPLVCKLPGGSPVLGFLAGGAVIGPHAFGLVKEIHAVQELAEFGVVFLLFNIGLELSLDRLQSMRKFVFGLGSAQFFLTTAAIAGACMLLGLAGPTAVIVGGAMALSSTAVALQVLQDRGESGSRHGRATFSVLLLQDLAVVALLMLIPLLAPKGGGSVSLGQIASALGLAAVKAVVCITIIISAGRAVLRPVFRKIASFENAEIFAATTLLTCIGTSLLTQVAGLSMALGAFLAGLLLAETEFALQVESDIAPFRGLLLGLFFMTVGMQISFSLFIAKWQTILAGIAVLIVGKVLLMSAVGPLFGLSRVASARAGIFLAPGGEFAFVAFGEAVAAGILAPALSNELFLVVALSMALTPYLAAFGQSLARFEQTDTKALVPNEGEVDDLRDHVIIMGFGRTGRVLAQIFSERLIPFVALDVQTDRVQAGRKADLPVFFGDCGSAQVLHSVKADNAACAVVALDSAAANYRAVWNLNKNFPHIRTYVRARDVQDGLNLEQAGACAVVPETLEPSLQLAAAVLGELKMPPDEVAASIDSFRRMHVADLRQITAEHGTSMGYGYTEETTAEIPASVSK